MICQVPEWTFPALFSPNFMRTLRNQTSQENRYLHAAALNAWKMITRRAQQTPESSLAIIVELTSKNGTPDFEHSSKAETLEKIALAADDDMLRKIVRHLHSLFIRPDTTEQNVADHRRQTVADLLLNIVKHYTRYDSLMLDFSEKDNWLRNTLDLLVEHAYFTPSKNAKTRKVPSPPITDSSRDMFRERLSSCLTRLRPLTAASQPSFGVIVVDLIRSKEASRSLEPTFQAEDSVKESLQKAYGTFDVVKAGVSLSPNLSLAEVYADIVKVRHGKQSVCLPRTHPSICLHFYPDLQR